LIFSGNFFFFPGGEPKKKKLQKKKGKMGGGGKMKLPDFQSLFSDHTLWWTAFTTVLTLT